MLRIPSTCRQRKRGKKKNCRRNCRLGKDEILYDWLRQINLTLFMLVLLIRNSSLLLSHFAITEQEREREKIKLKQFGDRITFSTEVFVKRSSIQWK